MKRLAFLVLLCLSTLACRNECEEAIDHWEDCVDRPSTDLGLSDNECSGKNECIAHCVTDADCLDLTKFADPSSTYYQCSMKC